jgi:hypothetical protein
MNNVTESTRDKINEIFLILEGTTNDNSLFILSTVLGGLLRDEDNEVIELALKLVNNFVRDSHDILREYSA